MAKTVHPIQDKVVVKRYEAKEVTESGIELAPGAVERPLKGKVIGVGQGRWLDDIHIKPTVTVGDVVFFGKNAGEEVEVDLNENVVVMRESEILAIVDE